MTLNVNFTQSESFPCSHQFIEENWEDKDYNFGFAEGDCSMCSDEKLIVLIQRGVFRFGCHSGICLDCLSDSFKNSPLNINLLYRFDKESFSEEQNLQHVVHYPVDIPCKILKYSRKIMNGDSEVELQQIQEVACLSDILKGVLKKAEKQDSEPAICKTCNGFFNTDLVTTTNTLREQGAAVVCCPGCLILMDWMRGCSTLSCKSKGPSSKMGCLSGRKICAFCLEGRTAEKISHSFSKCSNLLRQAVETASPLPLIKICTCEDSEIQKAE